MNPQEASGQDATVKKRAQLAFHKAWNHLAALPLPGQEGLEMAGYNAVEDALFRTAGAILAGGFADVEILAGEYKIAPLVLPFPLENRLWIREDHSPRSTSRSPKATT
jgi:hypothetical protein